MTFVHFLVRNLKNKLYKIKKNFSNYYILIKKRSWQKCSIYWVLAKLCNWNFKAFSFSLKKENLWEKKWFLYLPNDEEKKFFVDCVESFFFEIIILISQINFNKMKNVLGKLNHNLITSITFKTILSVKTF